MARLINRLSARSVAALAKPGYHADGNGLYLLIGPGGTKSWVFRYERQGRRREMGLGALAVVSLQEARHAALEHRKTLAAGLDPLDARRASRATGKTFGECADALIAAIRPGWKNDEQAHQWEQSLRDHGPPSDMPVADVDTPAVMACLSRIWTTKPDTAGRLRGRIERVLDWAKVHGLRQGENPARWRGHLDKLLPKPSKVRKPRNHPAMPYSALPAFWPVLTARDGIARLALQFTILTAARTSEVTLATWDEFDLDNGFWDRPSHHMKAKVAHTVPLVSAAVAILERLPRDKPPFALSENTMLFLLQKDLGQPNITVHGFRSTFRDWAGETTNHPREVIEHALAHQIKDKAEAAYARGTLITKRRRLMEDWAAYCLGQSASSEHLAGGSTPDPPPSDTARPLPPLDPGP